MIWLKFIKKNVKYSKCLWNHLKKLFRISLFKGSLFLKSRMFVRPVSLVGHVSEAIMLGKFSETRKIRWGRYVIRNCHLLISSKHKKNNVRMVCYQNFWLYKCIELRKLRNGCNVIRNVYTINPSKFKK